MSNLIIPGPTTRSPYASGLPVPNWSSPLMKHCTSIVTLVGTQVLRYDRGQTSPTFPAVGDSNGDVTVEANAAIQQLSHRFSGDATNDRVSLGTITSADPWSFFGQTEATIVSSFEYRTPNGTNDFPRVVDKSSAGGATDGWAFYYRVSTEELIYRHDFSSGTFAVNRTLTPGEHYFFGLNVTNIPLSGTATATAEYYLDGASVGSASPTGIGPWPSAAAAATIGNWQDAAGNRMWDGFIDFVAIFDKALSDVEHKAWNDNQWGWVDTGGALVIAEVATSASPVIIPRPPRSTSFSEVRGLSAKGLTLGLTSAGVLDGKGQPFDLVANEFLTPYSDAVPTVPTTEGMALEPGTGTTRSGDAYTIDHLGSNWLDGAAEFTLGVIWRYEGTDDTDEDSLIGQWNRVQGADSLDARRALLRYDNDATSSLDLFVTDSASSIVSIQANFDLDDGEFHWLVGRYDGANLQVFVDGQSIGTPTAFTGTVSSAAASFVPEVFGGQLVTSGGGTDSPRGQFKGWFISERAWTDAEIRDWYEPTTRWEWVDTGGPLIMAETAAPPAGSAPVYLFHNRHHNRSA